MNVRSVDNGSNLTHVMSILENIPPPDGVALHTETLTNAFIKDQEYGTGTLYITEEYVCTTLNEDIICLSPA